MSIATAIQNAQNKIAAAYTACNNKGATMPATQDLANLDDCIDTIPTGGGVTEAPMNDVIFCDYDGTILYSYSAADFANLASMPANPTHAGLTAQGWNWDLADAKAYVADTGIGVFGQMYTTTDGKTRLYINIYDTKLKSVRLCIYQDTAEAVSIDWGDESQSETSSSIGRITFSHNYSELGKYVIALTIAENVDVRFGGSTGYGILDAAQWNSDYVRNTILYKVEIGNNLTTLWKDSFKYCTYLQTISLPQSLTTLQCTFYQCSALRSAVLPKNVTAIVQALFQDCVRLTSCSLPKTITSTCSQVFYGCRNLRLVNIVSINGSTGANSFYNCLSLIYAYLPEGITKVSQNTFYTCTSLMKCVLPSTVTTIESSSFSGARSLSELYVRATVPPSLPSGIFNSVAPSFTIYVPNGTLATYQGATNWSTYSSKMVEMPA